MIYDMIWYETFGKYLYCINIIEIFETPIHRHHLLFGVPTPSYSNRNSTNLSIKVTIIDQFRQHFLEEQPYDTLSLIVEWIQKMKISANLIFARMKRPPYISHWLYSKPSRKILQNPDRHNWTSMIQTLFKSSTIPGDGPDASLSNQEFILTSDLQLPNSSDSE